MNLVAKPYQEYKQVGNAFTKNGKNYIAIETKEGLKEVRLYTVEEYNFLLGMQAKKDELAEQRRKVAQSYDEERKVNAGFKEGYIVAVLGDTYTHKEKLKDQGAKFSSQFKWYFEGGTEPICATRKLEKLGLPVRYLKWEEVSHTIETGATVLKPINEIEKLLKVEVPLKKGYCFQGEIGDTISETMKVVEIKIIDGRYGRHAMHILRNANGQIFIWNTTLSEMSLPECIYFVEGMIVNHVVFEGIRQTVLDNVIVNEGYVRV